MWGRRLHLLLKRLLNCRQNTFKIVENLIIREAQHAKPELAQPRIALRVIAALLIMLPAVELNHQPRLNAGEIGVTPLNRMLPPKAPAIKPPAPPLPSHPNSTSPPPHLPTHPLPNSISPPFQGGD